jgi:hypothetical protein
MNIKSEAYKTTIFPFYIGASMSFTSFHKHFLSFGTHFEYIVLLSLELSN